VKQVINWTLYRNLSPRLKATVLSVCAAGFTLVTMFGLGFAAGVGVDPELQYLSPGRQPTSGEAVVAQAMTYALSSREYNDVVFLGDSTCEMGIDPRVFAKETGLSAWNLGTMRGFGPYGFFLATSAYLGHHPAPKIVVLCITPTLFECDPSVFDGEMKQRLTWSYGAEIASPLEYVPFVARRGAANALNFWSPAVRSEPLEGMPRETYFTLAAKTRETRGFLALPGEHVQLNGMPPERSETLVRPEWDQGRRQLAIECEAHGVPPERPETLVRPEWDQGCRQIAIECEARGARFLIILAPLIDNFAKARDWPQIAQWGKSFHEDHPWASVTPPLFYKEARMWDMSHLNARGVEKFMPTVAKDVQAVVGGK
jgi:hypothetical protein